MDKASEKMWKEMERLANDSQYDGQGVFGGRELLFMNLLKDAYDNNLELIVPCGYRLYPDGLRAHQGYLDSDYGRLLVCFTSIKRARDAINSPMWKKLKADWDTMKAQEVMNNMFNKKVIWGLVFNPSDGRTVIIPKDMLSLIMPGEKPKPEFYREPEE